MSEYVEARNTEAFGTPRVTICNYNIEYFN